MKPGRPVIIPCSGAWRNVLIASNSVMPVIAWNANPNAEIARIDRAAGNRTENERATLDGTDSGSLISSFPLATSLQNSIVEKMDVSIATNRPCAFVTVEGSTLFTTMSAPAASFTVVLVEHSEMNEARATIGTTRSWLP